MAAEVWARYSVSKRIQQLDHQTSVLVLQRLAGTQAALYPQPSGGRKEDVVQYRLGFAVDCFLCPKRRPSLDSIRWSCRYQTLYYFPLDAGRPPYFNPEDESHANFSGTRGGDTESSDGGISFVSTSQGFSLLIGWLHSSSTCTAAVFTENSSINISVKCVRDDVIFWEVERNKESPPFVRRAPISCNYRMILVIVLITRYYHFQMKFAAFFPHRDSRIIYFPS